MPLCKPQPPLLQALVQPSQSDLQPQPHPQTGLQGLPSHHSLPAPRARREAAWPSCLKFDGPQVRVLMARQSMTDQDMDRWCEWFRCHVGRLWDQRLVASEVNFTGNRLTAAGVRRLLETFWYCRIPVVVLRLLHNRIEDGRDVAAFIAHSGGVLRELHLSHNELDAAGAAEVILATVSARDERGEFVYPKIWDGQPVPLWLRLEQNYVDHSELIKLLLPNFARIGRRSTVMCRMTDKGCTPGCCVRGTPAIHINHLKLQRVRAEPLREARGCETEASEVARQSMRTAATQTQTTSCGTLTACHSINPSHGHSGDLGTCSDVAGVTADGSAPEKGTDCVDLCDEASTSAEEADSPPLSAGPNKNGTAGSSSFSSDAEALDSSADGEDDARVSWSGGRSPPCPKVCLQAKVFCEVLRSLLMATHGTRTLAQLLASLSSTVSVHWFDQFSDIMTVSGQPGAEIITLHLALLEKDGGASKYVPGKALIEAAAYRPARQCLRREGQAPLRRSLEGGQESEDMLPWKHSSVPLRKYSGPSRSTRTSVSTDVGLESLYEHDDELSDYDSWDVRSPLWDSRWCGVSARAQRS